MKVKTIEWHKADPANLWPTDPAKPAQVWRGQIDGLLIANIRGNSNNTFTLNMNFVNPVGMAEYPAKRHPDLKAAMNAGQTLFAITILKLAG